MDTLEDENMRQLNYEISHPTERTAIYYHRTYAQMSYLANLLFIENYVGEGTIPELVSTAFAYALKIQEQGDFPYSSPSFDKNSEFEDYYDEKLEREICNSGSLIDKYFEACIEYWDAIEDSEDSDSEDDDQQSSPVVHFVPTLYGYIEPLKGGGRRNRTMKNKRNKRPRNENGANSNMITPQSKIVFLRYNDGDTARAATGTNFFAYRYRLNGLYDPDPLLFSGSAAGYNEWANFYRRYLVLYVIIEGEVINNENFPITMVIVPSDYDIVPSLSTRQSCVDTAELPYAKRFAISGLNGQNRSRFKMKINLSKLSGNGPAYRGSLLYSALNNTIPNTMLLGNFVFYSDNNFTAPNSIMVNTSLSFKVLWSQRQSPLS